MVKQNVISPDPRRSPPALAPIAPTLARSPRSPGPWTRLWGSAASLLLAWVMPGLSAHAQPVAAPDGTGTIIAPDGVGNYQIQGGASSSDGANLFHSFSQFNLTAGETATFAVSPEVLNVIARITNGQPSSIDGSVGLIGSAQANLFLLNPAGLLLGPNSNLSVPGSLVVSTANGLNFGDSPSAVLGQRWLSVYGTPDYANLLGSPTALGFSGLTGGIVNAGFLQAGNSVVLAGGTVVSTGTIIAATGAIHVEAIPQEQIVRFSPTGSILSLDLPLATDRSALGSLPFTPLSLPELLAGSDPTAATGAAVLADGTVVLRRSQQNVVAQPGAAIVEGPLIDGGFGLATTIRGASTTDLRSQLGIPDTLPPLPLLLLLEEQTQSVAAGESIDGDLLRALGLGDLTFESLSPEEQQTLQDLRELNITSLDLDSISQDLVLADLDLGNLEAGDLGQGGLMLLGLAELEEGPLQLALGAEGPLDLTNLPEVNDLQELAKRLEIGPEGPLGAAANDAEANDAPAKNRAANDAEASNSSLPTGFDEAQLGSALGINANWSLPTSTFDAFAAGNFNRGITLLEQTWEGQWSRYFGSSVVGNQPRNTTAVRDRLQGLARATGSRTAIVYLMLQDHQVEIVAIGPEGEPIYRRVGVDRADVLQAADELRATITNPVLRRGRQYLKPAQKLDRWLIAPLQAALGEQTIDTLLLSVDSGLRTVPFAALHDGQKFLVQRYALGLTPSLNLTDTTYVNLQQASVLAMGASEFVQQSPLPAVPLELKTVASELRQGEFFLNREFTVSNLERKRSQGGFSIVHLATHGEFRPGHPADSYLQFWDQERLTLDRLRELRLDQPPVDLLILSACRTAVGDREAELGFAGLAVQSGAKTAIASLWYVSDEGSLALMSELYNQLGQTTTKAQALRQAQVAMIDGRLGIRNGVLVVPGTRGSIPLPSALAPASQDFTHPYYWAAFAVIGSPW